ncbi:MAG: hypothetical protein DRJ10_12755 [Bacteroidetes bacterium]|nr:MAG: hypothetical protein DRJ10_12755 [Bacteroidota bacterium]
MLKINVQKIVSLSFILIILSGSVYAQKYRKYYHENGKLVQKITGNSKGTLTTYWDDYGYKEVKIEKTVTKMFGMSTETNKTTLMLGSVLYEWEEKGDVVTKMINDIAKTWEDGNYTAKQVEDMSIATLKQLGYTKTGTEVILGKTCDVWEGVGKSWAWKNLNLKAVVNVMGISITFEPVSLSLVEDVPFTLFELPKGKKVVNAGDQIPDDGSEESEQAKQLMKGLFNSGGN